MQIHHLSPSARIYLDQITNYIETGQGYQKLRVHLLKELNSIDPENPNSDESLVPALMENLRKYLLVESAEQKSRTIDIVEDLIKHADQVVDSYITSQNFCITLSTSIIYKFFNPFTKGIFDQNRLRLSSVVLFYYQRFQQNPTRYVHIFQVYKQLKQKNVTLPAKTYLVMPKVNEFKKITQKKSSSDKNVSQSQRIGVTFDSIIEFVKDCEKQFNNNKVACANTQFVRALKVKAKTLFDLSQNTQGLDLNVKEKQHAKQLYKQIRTMLKEIEKISEEKIKEQKIKSEKEFAQEKIEQMTPNKKKQINEDGSGSKKNIQKQSQNLLDDIATVQEPNKMIKTPNKKIQTPAKKKQESLLDDDNDNNDKNNQVNEDQNDEFTQYIGEVLPQSNKSIEKQVFDNEIKPLKKPPKQPQPFQMQQDQLIDTIEPSLSTTPKKTISQHTTPHAPALISTFSKKSIHSIGKMSINSQESDRAVNLIDTDLPTTQSPQKLASQPQNDNILDFENAQHFSKFEVINTFVDPNKYGQIPMDIDFSDNSSQKSAGSQRVTFDVAGNSGSMFESDQKQPYDRTFLTPKKQASHQQGGYNLTKGNEGLSQKEITDKLSLSANINRYIDPTSQAEHKPIDLIPNTNFGILADIRQVKPYDYSQIQNTYKNESISNISQEEQRKIVLTPSNQKSHKNVGSSIKNIVSVEVDEMRFNSQKKKKAGNQELMGEDDDEDGEEFGGFQQQEAFGMEAVDFGGMGIGEDVKDVKGEIDGDDGKILTEKTPEKGSLLEMGQYEEEGNSDSKVQTRHYEEPLL